MLYLMFIVTICKGNRVRKITHVQEFICTHGQKRHYRFSRLFPVSTSLLLPFLTSLSLLSPLYFPILPSLHTPSTTLAPLPSPTSIQILKFLCPHLSVVSTFRAFILIPVTFSPYLQPTCIIFSNPIEPSGLIIS